MSAKSKLLFRYTSDFIRLDGDRLMDGTIDRVEGRGEEKKKQITATMQKKNKTLDHRAKTKIFIKIVKKYRSVTSAYDVANKKNDHEIYVRKNIQSSIM